MKHQTKGIVAALAVIMMMAVPFSTFLITSDDVSASEIEEIDHSRYEISEELVDELLAAYSLDMTMGLGDWFNKIRVTWGTAFVALGLYILDVDTGDKYIGDQSEVDQTLRDSYAYTIQSNYTTATEIFGKLVSNQAMSMAFMRACYALQAETAASGLWYENGVYDGDRILIGSDYIEDMSVLKYNIVSTINQFAQKWDEEFLDTVNDSSLSGTYGSMQMGWSWGSNQLFSDGASFQLADYVTPTADSSRVYIDVITDEEAAQVDGMNNMYVFGLGTATIQNMTTGHTYSLPVGVNDLEALGIPSGWYILKEGYTYAGNFMASSASNGLSPNAALVLNSGTDLALAVKSGGSYTICYDNVAYVASDVTMTITYDDKTRTQDITNVLSSYQEVWDALNRATITTSDAGLTAWTLFDLIGESSILVKPSAILAGMQNTHATTEQIAAAYALALQKLNQLGLETTVDDLVMSKESLSLVMFGDIYYEGSMMYKNAVFTPYVPEDITLSVGPLRSWETTGLLLIYTSDVPSLETWQSSAGGETKLLEVSAGFSVQLYNIVYDGVEVSSIDLTTDKMTYLGLLDLDYDINPPTITVESKEKYVGIIVALLAIVIGLLGMFVPKSILTKIIIIAIAVVIFFVGGYFVPFIAGFF